MKSLWMCALALWCTSCGIYPTKFDCPPGKGVGCASVGQVLDLIVERDEGEDLFLNEPGVVLVLKQPIPEKKISPPKKKGKLRLVKQSTGELSLEQEEAKP